MLQYVSACSVLQHVAVCCSMLQYVAEICIVLVECETFLKACCRLRRRLCCRCCSMLQHVAETCIVLVERESFLEVIGHIVVDCQLGSK